MDLSDIIFFEDNYWIVDVIVSMSAVVESKIFQWSTVKVEDAFCMESSLNQWSFSIFTMAMCIELQFFKEKGEKLAILFIFSLVYIIIHGFNIIVDNHPLIMLGIFVDLYLLLFFFIMFFFFFNWENGKCFLGEEHAKSMILFEPAERILGFKVTTLAGSLSSYI